jgi:hypothetical protein
MRAKVAIIVALSLGARAQDLSPEREWGKRSGAFQLSLTADKAAYEVGEAVRVRVTLKNASDGPAMVRFNHPLLDFDIDVRAPIQSWIPLAPRAAMTEDGKSARLDAIFRSMGAQGFPLWPGKELTYPFELEKMFYMKAGGDYRVTFVARQYPLVTSNEIIVTLRQPL